MLQRRVRIHPRQRHHHEIHHPVQHHAIQQPVDERQMALPFSQAITDPIRDELRRLRPEEMSPLEALGVLYELHKKAQEGN